MVEIVCALAIGVLLLLILFSVFTPLPTPERLPNTAPSANAAEVASAVAGNPFRSTGAASAPVAAESDEEDDYEETKLNLTLHGTWIDQIGGAAIIRTPDGQQARFLVGDDIWRGVTLERVHEDRVIILSAGAYETLPIVNRDSALAQRVSRSEVGAGAPASNNAERLAISDIVRVVPTPGPGGVRLRLEPSTAQTTFEALGLASGDVLLSVDGRPVGQDIAVFASWLQSYNPSGAFTITVERYGRAVPIEIEPSALAGQDADDD
ncbi:MAG: type II secretion system protein N [Pseudomonadota bacterium]